MHHTFSEIINLIGPALPAVLGKVTRRPAIAFALDQTPPIILLRAVPWSHEFRYHACSPGPGLGGAVSLSFDASAGGGRGVSASPAATQGNPDLRSGRPGRAGLCAD